MSDIKYPFWLGGVAASMAAMITHPLDLTKVKMQTMPPLESGKRPTMFTTIQFTVRKQGLRGIYTGLSASIMRQLTYSLVRIGSYESIKRSLTQGKEGRNPGLLILSGAIAGGLGGIAGNPADVILVRMTSDSLRKPEKQFRYRNAVDGLLNIIRKEGTKGLSTGITANTLRAVLMNSSQLASYDYVKSVALGRFGMKDSLPVHVLCSTAAGFVATTVCSPADVIKSRVMGSAEALSVTTLLKTSLREEGVSFLFKGWTPAFTRLAPNTVFMFVFMEQLKRLWAASHA